MAVENVSINWTINNGVLNNTINSLKRANQEVQKLQTRIRALNSSFRSLGNMRINTSGLNNLSNSTNRANSSMTKAQKSALKLYTDLYRVGKINLNAVPEEFRNIVEAEKKTDVETAKLYQKMLRLKQINYSDIPQQFRNILRTTTETRQEMTRADTEAGRLYQSLYRAGRVRLNQIPPELREIATRATIAQRALKAMSNIKMSQLSSTLTGVGQNMMQMGRTMSMYVTAPIIAGLGASIKRSADFNQQIKNTGALTGATAKEMSKLKDQALDLGIKTKFSALEVAKGQTELMKAGRNLKQVFAEMGDVLDLAAAGDLKVARASEISANMMNMFSKEGVSAKKVADLMAGAANQSAIDVSEFYTSMSYVGGIASSLGIPLKDVSSVIAILGNNAVKGNRAGTGLRQFLSRLQPASEKAEEAMRSLGIITEDGANKFYTAKGKIKSFNDMVDVLRKSTEGLTDKEKQQKLDVMFGKIASPTLMALIKENSSAIDDMAKRIGKISAAKVAAEKLNTFSGAIEFLKGSIETFAVKVGDSLTPVLKILAKVLTLVFDKLYKLPKSVLGAISVFAIFIATIGPAVMIMGLFVTAIGALLTPVGLATTAIGALIGAGALGGLIALLASYTGGGKGLEKSLQGIKDKAVEIYKYLKDIWTPAIKYLLTGDKKELGKIEDKNFKNSLESAKKSIDTLSKTINKSVGNINKSLGEINEQDLNDFSSNIIKIVGGLSKAMNIVIKVIDGIRQAIELITRIDLELKVKSSDWSKYLPGSETKGEKRTADKARLTLAKMDISETQEEIKTVKRKVKVATTFEEKDIAQKELNRLNKDLEKQLDKYGKLDAKVNKKINVTGKVSNKLAQAEIIKSEKDLKKAIEKALKGNKKIEIEGNLDDKKLNKKIEKHNLDIELKIKSGEIKATKPITFDANINDTNAKGKIDLSNKSITDKSRIKIPDVMKNWSTNATVNDAGAKQKVDSSNTQIKNKANEKIPHVTKHVTLKANADNSSALKSVAKAINNIVSYAGGIAIPVITRTISIVGNIISSTKDSSKKSSTKKHALGTRYAEGGMALVGEAGAELVNLPRGSQVYNNQQTRSIMNNNNARNITINYSGNTGTDDKNRLTNMLRMAGVY